MGSTWTNTNELRVGNNGLGTLNIRDGGKVSNAAAYIGTTVGSAGTVTVEGVVKGNSQAVAWSLYRDYLLPFEIASIFLLVAMIGAVVLGRKQ